ncbi:MAG: hypothetical protein HN348_32890, partial [Proteobacteria bacterium]|nr:hypothetical protein [Pseudomonadota bacterium]
FYRDSSISFLRTIAANRNVIISARRSGKIKAIVQGVGTQIIFVALVVNAFFPDLPLVEKLPWWTMLVVTIVTAGSFLDYFSGNFPLLRDAWSNRPVK